MDFKCIKIFFEFSFLGKDVSYFTHTAIFSVLIHTTASRDPILRRSPDVEFTSDSRTQLRDVIWIKYISTTTEEM